MPHLPVWHPQQTSTSFFHLCYTSCIYAIYISIYACRPAASDESVFIKRNVCLTHVDHKRMHHAIKELEAQERAAALRWADAVTVLTHQRGERGSSPATGVFGESVLHHLSLPLTKPHTNPSLSQLAQIVIPCLLWPPPSPQTALLVYSQVRTHTHRRQHLFHDLHDGHRAHNVLPHHLVV